MLRPSETERRNLLRGASLDTDQGVRLTLHAQATLPQEHVCGRVEGLLPMASMTFIPAVLALLLAPGPTNTLMGIAGAQAGLGRVLCLLPAEVFGYLTTVLPLVFLGERLFAHWPAAGSALKLLAALWVLFIALKLWQAPGSEGAAQSVTARRIYLTTMLNPKALIFGLVLLPAPQDPSFPGALALFCLMVSGVALVWGAAGRLTQVGLGAGAGEDHGGPSRRLVRLQRLAAVWLAFVSASLIFGLVTSA